MPRRCARGSAWRADPEVRARLTTAQRERRRNDPSMRLRSNVSRGINKALRTGKGGKTWEALVGYTANDLRAHLERQFSRGMTWSNMGTAWEVDHIIPVASFGPMRAGDDAFRACWALTNLRPLGKRANRSKRATRDLLV